MIKKSLTNIFLSLLFTVTSIIFVGSLQQPAYAQPDPCPNPPCDGDVPISGIEWLLLAGGLFGAKKIQEAYKKRV